MEVRRVRKFLHYWACLEIMPERVQLTEERIHVKSLGKAHNFLVVRVTCECGSYASTQCQGDIMGEKSLQFA